MPAFSVPNAYYSANVTEFIEEPTEAILGTLTAKSAFAVEPSQRDAWVGEIAVLKSTLVGLDGTVFLEFDVPRIGSRIDAVLVIGPAIFVIEFKVGERQITTHDINQAWDYALDLKNFHLASHSAPILPILVATESESEPKLLDPADDLVYRPITCNAKALGHALRLGIAKVTGATLDPEAWARAPYRPSPTIIEAAQALYSHHSVDSIARHDAEARNLGLTSNRVEEIIDLSRNAGRKAIVFVTGVPGAGKTLVGLNVATKKRDDAPTHAVYLSGNGPLVKVLREALARDEMARLRAKKDRTRKGVVQQKIKSFIQNVHHFRDAGLDHAESTERSRRDLRRGAACVES